MKLNRSKLMIILSAITIAMLSLNVFVIYNLCDDKQAERADVSELNLKKD